MFVKYIPRYIMNKFYLLPTMKPVPPKVWNRVHKSTVTSVTPLSPLVYWNKFQHVTPTSGRR